MKLGSRIEGLKVPQVGYRMLLTNKALDIDLPGFSAQNRVEDGRQVIHVFFEGDESQVSEFKRFIESNKPPEAVVSSITFQDYQGKGLIEPVLLPSGNFTTWGCGNELFM